jgi:hypothetical protein
MIPIAFTIFWGPMAIAIMGGLLVATILTLVYVPSLYAVVFGIREGESGASAAPPPVVEAAPEEQAAPDAPAAA